MEEINNNVQKNSEKKIKKVGRLTFGVTLVIAGIVILLQLVLKFDVIKYVTMSWPIILIILGIEVIYYSRKNDVNIKYDVAGIILTFIVLFVSSIFSLVTFGIDKISKYDESKIVNEVLKNDYTMSFKNGVEIDNLTDGKINVKKQIREDFEGTYVIANIDYKDDFKPLVISVMNDNYSLYNMIKLDENSKDFSKISIINMPNYVESIEFIITTSNENLIKISGNINNI